MKFFLRKLSLFAGKYCIEGEFPNVSVRKITRFLSLYIVKKQKCFMLYPYFYVVIKAIYFFFSSENSRYFFYLFSIILYLENHIFSSFTKFNVFNISHTFNILSTVLTHFYIPNMYYKFYTCNLRF